MMISAGWYQLKLAGERRAPQLARPIKPATDHGGVNGRRCVLLHAGAARDGSAERAGSAPLMCSGMLVFWSSPP